MPATSGTIIPPASLRSDRGRNAVGTSGRDQIGITVHLHRNQHLPQRRRTSTAISLPPTRGVAQGETYPALLRDAEALGANAVLNTCFDDALDVETLYHGPAVV